MSNETEWVVVKRGDLLRWAEDFARDNDPGDDTDIVTPFDGYLLQAPSAPVGVEGLADADIKWDMRHIEPHLKDADAAIPVLLQGVRRAIKRALAQQPAAVDGAMELVRDIAEQAPEKPDHWSSCSQCESNIDRAQEVLAAQPGGSGNEG